MLAWTASTDTRKAKLRQEEQDFTVNGQPLQHRSLHALDKASHVPMHARSIAAQS
jgi:hypothetical protein